MFLVNHCTKSRSIVSILSLAALVSFFTQPGHALNPGLKPDQYIYSVWTTQEGLPLNGAQGIAQTSDGYLWVGTQSGLVRFDGDGFKPFTTRQYPALQCDFVMELYTDRSGALWSGSELGIARVTGGPMKFWGADQGLNGTLVTSMAEDSEGRLWIALTAPEVFLLDDGVISSLPVDPSRDALVVKNILAHSDGTMWLATNSGVYRYQNGSFHRYGLDKGLPTLRIEYLFEDKQGGLWAGTMKGLAEFGGNRFHVSKELKALSDVFVTALMQDSDGNLWIGSSASGVFLYRAGRLEPMGAAQFSRGEIDSILEDKEGSVWVGVSGTGLVQVRDPKVTVLKTGGTEEVSMTFGLLEDSKNNLWIATLSEVAKFTNGELAEVFRPDNSSLNERVLAIYESKNGDILLGTHGSGVYRYRGGRVSSMASTYPELAQGSVRAILQDEDGRIWFGTRHNGLYLYDGNKLVEHVHGKNKLRANRISSLVHGPDGSVLISTEYGLIRYRNGMFDQWSQSRGFPKVRVFEPYFDLQGNLWLGSIEDGLFLYRSDGSLHSFDTSHGLLDNSAFSIKEDVNGLLWISCNRGLYSVAKQQLFDVAAAKRKTVNIDHFGAPDGLKSEECNGGIQYAGIETHDGQLVFACIDGAVVVDTNNMKINEVVPPVMIEHALLNGDEIAPGETILSGNQRFDFEFSALSYVAPKSVEILYMLEGFDEDWRTVDRQRAAAYTSLPPGSYQFKVKAANSDGVWNEEGASFSFEVEAPYYQKAWFVIVVALCMVAFVLLLVSWATTRARQRSGQLSTLAWERTRGVLEGQVDAIRELIGDSSKVSDDIRDMMDQLATSSEQVAAAVTETAATVKELEQTGMISSQQASRIVDAAKKTEDETMRGREAVARSVRMMAGAQHDSAQIVEQSKAMLGRVAEVDSIARLVGEISEQSAVLSINAAIEASKAGEFGTGFGVVAENMQELAGRSKDATVHIAKVLSDINDAIEQISELAVQGRERMNDSVESIKRSGDIVSSLSTEMTANSKMAKIIAQSIDQQMTGLKYIANAVAEFTSTVDENKSISGNLAIGSNKLGKSISNLLETIEGWKTPEFYQS